MTAPVDDHQFLGRRPAARLDPAVEHAFEERRRQRRSEHPGVALLAALREVGVRQVASGQELAALFHRQPRQVRPGADARRPLAEFLPGLERHRFDRASLGLAARLVGVVVGEAGRRRHLQRGLGLEVVEHLGRGVDVGLDQLGIGLGAEREAPDVRDRLVAGVGDPELGEVLVQRDPRHAARYRRRPAEQVGLLQQQHLGAPVMGEDGGGETGRAGTENDDIDHLVPGGRAARDHMFLQPAGRRATASARR